MSSAAPYPVWSRWSAGAAEVPGGFGWDGGYGTPRRSDPEQDPVAILMTQLCSRQSMDIYRDFWAAAYRAIDD